VSQSCSSSRAIPAARYTDAAARLPTPWPWPGPELEPRNLRLLVPVDDHGGASIELVATSNRCSELVGRHAARALADVHVRFGRRASGIRNTRLADPVMQKCVGALLTKMSRREGLPTVPRASPPLFRPWTRASVAISATLPRQQTLSGLPGWMPTVASASRHEIHHVVGVALGADAVDVPCHASAMG